MARHRILWNRLQQNLTLYGPLSMLAQPITLVAVVSALFGPSVEGARRCSLVPFPVSRDSATTVILGVGARETASVGAGGVSYSRFGGHWGRSLFGRIRAQSVRVRELSGAQTAEIAAYLRASTDSTVWIVPWDYGPSCAPVVWGRPLPWAPLDSLGTFTVVPRARRAWHRGKPTFDAFTADLEPYPHGEFFRAGYRETDAVARGDALTAEQFFEFYLALPTWSPYDRDAARRSPVTLIEWLTRHPEQVERFPVAAVRRVWRHALGDSVR